MVAAYFVSLFLLIVWYVGTERLRDVIDARRVRERGIGGTQDVFLGSLPVGVVLMIANGVIGYHAVAALRERANG